MEKRASTGIPGLDALTQGGFPEGRAILLCGGPGSGKTILGLQFLLEGIEHREPGIFVGIDEKPGHLIQDAAALGWDLTGPIQRGELQLLDPSPFFTATRKGTWTGRGIDARHVAGDLVQQVRKSGARRLVIDSITSLVPPELSRAETHDYLRALIQSWEDNLGCTVLLTCRGSRRDPNGSCDTGRALASGVIVLRAGRAAGGEGVRTICVRKMRGTDVDLVEHPIQIARGTGLDLRESAASSVNDLFRRRPRPVADTAPPPLDRPAAV